MTEVTSEMVTEVTDYLKKAQDLSLDREMLPGFMQAFGVKKYGEALALWDKEGEADSFDVRLGGEPDAPFVVAWTYVPQ